MTCCFLFANHVIAMDDIADYVIEIYIYFVDFVNILVAGCKCNYVFFCESGW